jgi:hypothetical protein
MAAVSFATTIKPYFTSCYRAHMMNFGDQFDLWDPAQVQAEFQQIQTQVSLPAGTPGSMPASGCPEGVWDAMTRAQFLTDFQAWQAGGFQP